MGIDPNDPTGGAGGFSTNIDPTEIFKMFFGSEGGEDMGGLGGLGGFGGFPFGGARMFTTSMGGNGA